MASLHKFQLNSQDQQLFSFGKKFYGKKLDQIRTKKDFVQILRDKGLMDYLDRKIITNDVDNLSRFAKTSNKTIKIRQLGSPRTTTNKVSTNNNEFPGIDSVRVGNKTKQFRNIKNPNKAGAVTAKNYVNNVLIKPKYNQKNQKTSTPLQILNDFQNRDMRSMPIIFQTDDHVESFNNFNRGLATLNNIPSFTNLHFLDYEFLNNSRSVNEIELENKQMEEKMEFLKNYLGEENQMLKIKKTPFKRASSFEPRKRSIKAL